MVYGSKLMPENSAVLKDNIDLQESLLLMTFSSGREWNFSVCES